MIEKHYINLTNGIEWIENIPIDGFLRIRSTTLERHDFLFLMMDLDHNLLMHLALGYKCIIYNCGTRKEFSRTVYQGIPIINYILNRRWYDINPDFIPRVRRNGTLDESMNLFEYFDHIYKNLFVHDMNSNKVKLKVKLDYYKRFLGGIKVLLEGKSISTINDGNYDYFSSKIKEFRFEK